MDRNLGCRSYKLLGTLLLTVMMVGCRQAATIPPGLGPNPRGLEQPVTLAEIYWATPSRTAPGLPEGETPLAAVEPAALISRGEALYEVHCAVCHYANGEGNLNRFPALNQNAFVTNDVPQPLIQTVLYGRGTMPAFHSTLSAHEVAAILSYIRNSWNNQAAVVQPDTVLGLAPIVVTTPTPTAVR